MNLDWWGNIKDLRTKWKQDIRVGGYSVPFSAAVLFAFFLHVMFSW